MKRDMLAHGSAHRVLPVDVLHGYRVDVATCQSKLPPGTSSLVKMHLDFFQMSHFKNLPQNIEICDDLLQLDQPQSLQSLYANPGAGKACWQSRYMYHH